MVHSMESSRPIMSQSVTSVRASKRFSTFSGAPSISPSVATSTNSSTHGDPRMQDIKDWTNGLSRLDSQKLQSQRYTPTSEKSDDLAKLALGAKVERALERRMTGQDAVMRPRVKKVGLMAKMGEKSG